MTEASEGTETMAPQQLRGAQKRPDNDQIQTRFIPAGDGPMQGLPQAWSGARSGIRFSSRWEDGYPILTIHLEAELPLEVNEQMRDEGCLLSQAEAFDLAFKVAIDDEVDAAEITRNAISLTWVRNFLASSYNHLNGNLEASRRGMEISPENAFNYRRSRRSIETLRRTVKRIDARMNSAVPAPLANAILAGDRSSHWH